MSPERVMPPRLVPDVPLPPYAHVPGRTPHPESDPAGHSFGHARTRPPAVDECNWRTSHNYLRGFDLFNAGYYWEAHEAWEGLWHAAGRSGRIADLLKGLIRLAAAGVKAREGRLQGVASHAGTAARYFRVAGAVTPSLLGLSMPELARCADLAVHSPTAPEFTFPFVLAPDLEAAP